MKSIIIGTAGHIDHGKTALVRALTGIDTDRLEEEKRRGITIDLGFAHLELAGASGEKLRFGFIDVPGHERFVRNMLAGVGGIDLVLLVVAADESIKPQTREHFEICRLLSIPRGITVITKTDLVDEEMLNVVRLEIEEFVRGSFLDTSRSPVVAVSARTGAGLEQLKQEMSRLAAEVPARDTEALFRLPIDRVFVMKGFGTVVTGTLIAGRIQKEEEVEVFPGRRHVRIRGVQVHGNTTDKASAGQRTALNLAGATVEDLARGMTLAAPGVLEPSQEMDVQLSLLKDSKPLKNRARVHLHAFTSETIAEVTLHEGSELKPGACGLARLRSVDPLMLLPGDRAILRQFSPVVTIGGAVVLDAFPVSRQKQKKDARLDFLNILSNGTRQDILAARIVRRSADGLSADDAVREMGIKKNTLQPVIASLLQQKKILQAGDRIVAVEAFSQARGRAVAALDSFHKANPLVGGISKEELREKLGLRPEVMQAVLDELVNGKKAEVTGEQVRLAGRGVELKDEEAKAKKEIEQAFAGAGLKVPYMDEVLARLPVDKTRAQKLVTLLLRDRVLVKLADNLVFHQSALRSLRQTLTEYKAKSPKIDVGKFKDLTGVSRKYAIPLLEYLDRERVTRRVGDERVIL
ncbi:MAG TPA: selenocysteine-specific translation elongation factor [Candidatus Angelobacter sp.]|nr:selenocysteine-specific translation elongation factor [Candidatus Angelobacter sp.]